MKINSWLRTTGFVDLGLGLGLVDCIALPAKLYTDTFDSIFSSCSPVASTVLYLRPEYLQGRLNHWLAIGRKVDQH